MIKYRLEDYLDKFKRESIYQKLAPLHNYFRDPLMAACMVFLHDYPFFQVIFVTFIMGFKSFLDWKTELYHNEDDNSFNNLINLLFNVSNLLFLAQISLKDKISIQAQYTFIGYPIMITLSLIIFFEFKASISDTIDSLTGMFRSQVDDGNQAKRSKTDPEIVKKEETRAMKEFELEEMKEILPYFMFFNKQTKINKKNLRIESKLRNGILNAHKELYGDLFDDDPVVKFIPFALLPRKYKKQQRAKYWAWRNSLYGINSGSSKDWGRKQDGLSDISSDKERLKPLVERRKGRFRSRLNSPRKKNARRMSPSKLSLASSIKRVAITQNYEVYRRYLREAFEGVKKGILNKKLVLSKLRRMIVMLKIRMLLVRRRSELMGISLDGLNGANEVSKTDKLADSSGTPGLRGILFDEDENDNPESMVSII